VKGHLLPARGDSPNDEDEKPMTNDPPAITTHQPRATNYELPPASPR